MRYAIDLIDAIALADRTRGLREVLMENQLPHDSFIISESVLREILGEYVAGDDIDQVIQAVRERKQR